MRSQLDDLSRRGSQWKQIGQVGVAVDIVAAVTLILLPLTFGWQPAIIFPIVVAVTHFMWSLALIVMGSLMISQTLNSRAVIYEIRTGNPYPVESPRDEAERAVLLHLGDRYSIEHEGAYKYLCHKGHRVSDPHHWYFLRGSKVYGELGTKTEQVKLPS